MAYEETKDLIAACERMAVAVPVLFVNLATPASDCPLCMAVHRRESEVRRKFREAFPRKSHTLVYRQGEPRGMEALESLGQVLYEECAYA